MNSAFAGGGYAEARFTDRFAIRQEALFTRKGGTGDVVGALEVAELGLIPFTGDVTLTLDYVELPLLAVFSFPASSGLTSEAVAGPAVGFNTRAKRTVALTFFESFSVGWGFPLNRGS